MAKRISIKFGDRIRVAIKPLWVAQNFCKYALVGRKLPQ